MSQIAIHAQGIAKSYRLGEATTLFSRLRPRMLGRKPQTDTQTMFRALDNVSFEIKVGEVVGIIGHNGAGKSTLLKVLSRITEPTEGRAVIHGRVASLLEIGTGFHPELTGRDNIFVNGAILGMHRSEISRHFDEIIEFAGVEKFIDTPVKRYSTGMYVRLAFSVAAHLQPEILIVDEVLAVGDAEFQKKCLGKMGEVGRQGRTVLFVSHNMAAVRQLTTRCILLHQGKIEYDGDPSTAIERLSKATFANFTQGADLAKWPRAVQKQDQIVTFRSLRFDRVEPIFQPNEPIVFNVALGAKEAVSFLRVSGVICRSEGTPVGAFYSPCVVELKAGEERLFRICIADHHIAPGAYKFRLAAGIGNATSARRDFDIINDVLPFEIALLSEAGTASGWPPDWGAINFESVELNELTSDRHYQIIIEG